MMLGYETIRMIAAQKGVLEVVVEKDYVLDWILLSCHTSNVG